MSHETLVNCIAEGMWNATPSHCEVSWREQLRLWPDAPETKAFLQHAEAAARAVRHHELERLQNITYPATCEEQLAVVESMMTCYDTPITQAAGYTRDLLRTIIALEKSLPSGFSYEDQTVPYAFLQWKGTDACFDFHCKCGAFCHWDGCFAYYVQCPHCKTTYQMPFNLFPREVAQTDGHEPKVLQSDEECEAEAPVDTNGVHVMVAHSSQLPPPPIDSIEEGNANG